MELIKSLICLSNEYIGKSVSPPIALKGDGSDRRIYRFIEDGQSWIGVINSNIAENDAFIFLSNHLLNCGIPVPKIYRYGSQKQCYLLEDLGEFSLADLLIKWSHSETKHTTAILNAYKKVMYWLPRIQCQAHKELDYTFCFRERFLDGSVFLWDINYFKNYFYHLFVEASSIDPFVDQELQRLVNRLNEVPKQGLVTRDFQSRNIMWKGEETYFIDYQMACQGALHYDVASLLYASSAKLNDDLRMELIDIYLQELNCWTSLSKKKFLEDFYHFVLMRRLRSLGSYGFLASQKKKHHFLEAIPATLREISNLLKHQRSLKLYPHLRELFSQWQGDKEFCSGAFLFKKVDNFSQNT